MILFTADWHIKLGQKNVPIEWATNRYRSFFSQIQEIEQEVDLHIISTLLAGLKFQQLYLMETMKLLRRIKHSSLS
jgi:hypothetical protein